MDLFVVSFTHTVSQFHLVLSDDEAQDGGQTESSKGTGSLVQLPEHTYRYLAIDLQLDRGRKSD